MHSYQWIGITMTGTIISGAIDANNRQHANDQLQQQQIIVRKITKQNRLGRQLSTKKIKKIVRLLFTQQLAILIDAGVSLSAACEALSTNQTHSKIKQAIELIKKDIEMGCMLSESLRKQPHLFNSFFCNVIEVGEHAGTLSIVLKKLAEHEKKNASIKKKITGILTYPGTVFFIGMLITALLLTTVIPQFEALFANFGAKLPLITRCVVYASEQLRSNGLYIACFITSVGFGFYYTYQRKAWLVQRVQTLFITLPLLGNLLKYQAIARFSRLLSLLFAAGLPLTESLQLVADVTGNHLYEQAVHIIRQNISKGSSIKQAIMQTQLFPDLVSQMVGIGEESGSLDTMLNHIADIYEEEINSIIERISHFLEPTIMALLGFMVGTLVIAMYLPIITLGTVI